MIFQKIDACPISHDKVDERVARLNGLFTLFFVIGGIFFKFLWILIALDLVLRAFKIKYSPIARLSKIIVTVLKYKPVPIDAAPKKFAAKMGLAMSILLIVFDFFNFYYLVNVMLLIFVTAILLEVVMNYCVGCKIYSVLINLGIISLKKVENNQEELEL